MTTCALPLSITIKISCLYRPVLVFLYTKVRPTGQLINKLPYTIKYICETLFTVISSTIDNNFYIWVKFSLVYSPTFFTMKRTRKQLTGAQKKKLCERKKDMPFLSNDDLAKEFGIGKSTVQGILVKSSKWLSINEVSIEGMQKRERPIKWQSLEDALWLWVSSVLDRGLDLTGDIIKQKALFYAERMGFVDFKGSDGWLTGFKRRCKLVQVVKHGEAASAPNQELVDEERLSIQEELTRWKLDDIFNADETGLFWAMEPSRTLSDRKLSGHKANKSRVTVLLITNVNGSEKLRPVVIHKYQTPRPLRNINKSNLPVDYYWNGKAYMQVSVHFVIITNLY